MPIRNFQEGFLEDAGPISSVKSVGRYARKRKGCFHCMIECSHYYSAGEGYGEEGAEYESIVALGPRCGSFDLKAILQANAICNRLGSLHDRGGGCDRVSDGVFSEGTDHVSGLGWV